MAAASEVHKATKEKRFCVVKIGDRQSPPYRRCIALECKNGFGHRTQPLEIKAFLYCIPKVITLADE